jgi:hypothetical protein
MQMQRFKVMVTVEVVAKDGETPEQARDRVWVRAVEFLDRINEDGTGSKVIKVVGKHWAGPMIGGVPS